ncbi:MAG: hypothetical protein ACO38W_12505 [Phycisphaerales bacterium]
MNLLDRLSGRVLLATLVLSAAFVSACGAHRVKGRVVEGDFDFITVVSGSAARLAAAGIGSTRISFTRDPGRLNSQQVGSGVSDPEGSFDIEIDAFGAGWMSEEWLVRAVRSRFGFAEGMVRLPKPHSDERLLITIRRASPEEVLDFERRPSGRGEDLYREADLWRTP